MDVRIFLQQSKTAVIRAADVPAAGIPSQRAVGGCLTWKSGKAGEIIQRLWTVSSAGCRWNT